MVDKVYLILPEFKVIRHYDRKQFAYDLLREQLGDRKIDKETFNNLLHNFISATYDNLEGENDEADESIKEIRKLWKQHKSEYEVGQPTVERIEYDLDKPAKDNSRAARNNMLLEMMYGVMSNSDTMSKIMNPGNFDPLKRTDRIVSILNNISQGNIDTNILAEKFGTTNISALFKALFNASLDDLEDILSDVNSSIDPLSPKTQVDIQQRNMAGANLIPIYANHNANHAIIQHTQLGIMDDAAFTLNGKKYTSLHDIRTEEGQLITKTVAMFLAASVDNAKEPVMEGNGQNLFTADASMLLARLGHTPLTIGLLMSQPIVREIVTYYSRNYRKGVSKKMAIQEVLQKYIDKAKMANVKYESIKNRKFLDEELAENLYYEQRAGQSTQDELEHSESAGIREWYGNQAAVGLLFQQIFSVGEALREVVAATRSDTPNGAAGPSIAHTMNKISKVEDLLEHSSKEKFPLYGANVIEFYSRQGSEVFDADHFREEALQQPLPYMFAFFNLGLVMSERIFGKYFPQYTRSFYEVMNEVKVLTKTERLSPKTLNTMYNDLFAYIMSSLEFFGESSFTDSEGVTHNVTSKDKRDYFINAFPSYFERVKSENPDIAEIEFIKRLKFIRANRYNPVATIQFKNVGNLTQTLREAFTRDWLSLAYSSNPEANKLAFNLFLYSYYRGGFGFGPATFIHLAPIMLRMAIKGYNEKLQEVTDNKSITMVDAGYAPFIDQFFRNHLDNRELVPQVTIKNDEIEFIDDNGVIADEIEAFIDPKEPGSKRGLIKDIVKVNGIEIVIPVEYFATKVKGKKLYYKLSSSSPTGAIKYQRIMPLGYTNSFIEYEFGVGADAMQSSIYLNDKNYKSKKDKERDQAVEKYASQDAEAIDYDAANERASYQDDAYFASLAGLSVTTGKKATSESNSNENATLNDVEPKEDYKDAEQKPSCPF